MGRFTCSDDGCRAMSGTNDVGEGLWGVTGGLQVDDVDGVEEGLRGVTGGLQGGQLSDASYFSPSESSEASSGLRLSPGRSKGATPETAATNVGAAQNRDDVEEWLWGVTGGLQGGQLSDASYFSPSASSDSPSASSEASSGLRLSPGRSKGATPETAATSVGAPQIRSRYTEGSVPGGVNGDEAPLEWAQAVELLQGKPCAGYPAALPRRPSKLQLKSSRQLFLERPRAKRRRNQGDKWLNSGGKKGSIVTWHSAHLGVRKRYGTVVLADVGTKFKFAQFSLVTGGPTQLREDQSATLFSVRCAEKTQALEAAAHTFAHTASGSASVRDDSPVLTLRANHGHEGSFVSFRSEKAAGQSFEMGSIRKHGAGVKLESAQGTYTATALSSLPASLCGRSPRQPASQPVPSLCVGCCG
jgi:hypothetical protein